MSDSNDGGEKQSFWTTLPGILTGVAGVISSVAALVTAINLIVKTIGGVGPGPETPDEDIVSEKSCQDHKNSNSSLKTGDYTIDPDGKGGADSFKVWCDMETDGGGWTLLAKSNLVSSDPLGFVLQNQKWVDVFQNFKVESGDTAAAISEEKAFSYDELDSNNPVFFANVQALGKNTFSQVLLNDGKHKIVQSYSTNPKETTSLAKIHEGQGVSPLYDENGEKSGLILMLGKALSENQKDNSSVCYYPKLDTLTPRNVECEPNRAFEGDNNKQTTAFYVGSLTKCQNTNQLPTVSSNLWGGRDCYEKNQAGGFGGFTAYRSYNDDASVDGWISSGYLGNEDPFWEIYIR